MTYYSSAPTRRQRLAKFYLGPQIDTPVNLATLTASAASTAGTAGSSAVTTASMDSLSSELWKSLEMLQMILENYLELDSTQDHPV